MVTPVADWQLLNTRAPAVPGLMPVLGRDQPGIGPSECCCGSAPHGSVGLWRSGALTAAWCIPGETFVLGDGLPGPLEPRLDPMDSALNSVNSSSHSRSSRDYRLPGYRHLHQPSSLSQGSTSALRRLSSGGKSSEQPCSCTLGCKGLF